MRWQLMAPVLSYLREFTSANVYVLELLLAAHALCAVAIDFLDAPQVHTLNILLAFLSDL